MLGVVQKHARLATRGAEARALGDAVGRCGEMPEIERPHEKRAEHRAKHLPRDIPTDETGRERAVHRQRDRERWVEVRPGRRAEDEGGQHHREAPSERDLHRAAALHAGPLQQHVRDDAVAQKYEHRRPHELGEETCHSVHLLLTLPTA